jgi:hypothetical protein
VDGVPYEGASPMEVGDGGTSLGLYFAVVALARLLYFIRQSNFAAKSSSCTPTRRFPCTLVDLVVLLFRRKRKRPLVTQSSCQTVRRSISEAMFMSNSEAIPEKLSPS